MRLLVFLVSPAFCSAFTVTDILNPETAAERQSDVEDQILPVFLITFIGALLVNILTLDTDIQPTTQPPDIQEEKVQGIFILIMPSSCLICLFPNVFTAVLITGNFKSGGFGYPTTAEIYIPSNSSSCVLPDVLPFPRQHSNFLSTFSFQTNFQI